MGHWQIHMPQCVNAHMHIGIVSPTQESFAHAHAYAHTHAHTHRHKWWQWKDYNWVGTGSWVTLPLVPVQLCPTFHGDNLWNVRMFARENVCLSGKRSVRLWEWILHVFRPKSKWTEWTRETRMKFHFMQVHWHRCTETQTHTHTHTVEDLSIEFQAVRKSTRMWSLSQTINTPCSAFLIREMSTSRRSLAYSIEIWLTPTPSQVMQMQTCIIFAQIPVHSIVITAH